MSALTTFPLARYRFEWRVSTPLRLPDFAGSTLRGAFGHALRQLACMTHQKECGGCPLISTCPYPAIFSPPPPAEHTLQKFSAIPVPYVIEPPECGSQFLVPGDKFTFNMVLIGNALKELPLIILAWRRALARGIGAGDGTAELTGVFHCNDAGETAIHRPDMGAISVHPQIIQLKTTEFKDSGSTRATLHFSTPLRLQLNGHALPPDKLNTRTLLMALVRRANLLAEFHGNGPLLENFTPLLAAAAEIRDEKRLVWRDWTRYSSRQQQKMTLGGVVGEWVLEGSLGPFAHYLDIGQWLHVGKEAAFGLGRYSLTNAT